VSAGAGPPEREQPAIIAAIDAAFGPQTDLAVRYADFLVTEGIKRGAIGPREADRVWERHILNSVAPARLIHPGSTIVDLGSGAGLPGIPIAIARPDLHVILLEPLARRVRLLQDGLAVLAMPNVEICHARAQAGPPGVADYVVVRAVARLDALITLSWGMLKQSGVLLALKGTSAAGELDLVRQTMTVDAELLTLDAPGVPATVLRVSRPVERPALIARPSERMRRPRRRR
jgi:16S rRNA (guanine527-N7)-methyltransferase